MTLSLTTQAENELKKGLYTPQIVVQIDDFPLIVSGETFILDSRLEGLNTPDFYNLLDLKQSTREINQQLKLEKGGSSSTTTYKARCTDVNGAFVSEFSYVTANKEILERGARVYFGFEGGEFPRDFVPFINGTVGNINFGSGFVDISINHPDKERKQEIFQPKTSELDGNINNSVTTIPIVDASEFLLPVANFRTFVLVNDEIIEYTGISGNNLTGATRGSFDSIAVSHGNEDEVTSWYELSGQTLDIALKILLSGSGETDASTVMAINDSGIEFIQNAIFFNESDVRERVGASTGDFISLASTTFPGNDFTDRNIVDFGQTGNISYYIVDGANLTTETLPTAETTFQSVYDVLPDGCGLRMHQVDLAEFERVSTLFSSRFLDFNFYLKEEFEASEFINEKLFLPSSFYHLPRKGKNSVGAFNPPLTDLNTIRIDETAILNKTASKIVVERSSGKNFYNFAQYKINEDTLDDKLLTTFTILSANSTQRINAKNTGLKIESGGLRRNTATTQVIRANTEKILERYQYGAEQISCVVRYSTGLKVEIGDPVVFGSAFLQIGDSTRGDREFQPRIMQCVNKSVNFTTGQCKLTLLDTSYSLNARFGIISPSSNVTAVVSNQITSTPTCPIITDSERETWTPFIGTRIQLRLPDFSYAEEFTITDVTDSGEILLDSAPDLSFLPSNNGQEGAFNKTYTESDLILESTKYPSNTNAADQGIWKDVYVYFNPRLTITNVIDESNFEVSAADIAVVNSKAVLKVHSPDFTNISQEVNVSEINSNQITTNTPLEYLPVIGDEVSLVGFIDGGLPFRWF